MDSELPAKPRLVRYAPHWTEGEAAYSCLTLAIVADFYDPHIGVMRTMELAEHNPIHSISGFWNAYSDAGLFGFYLVVEPGLDAVVKMYSSVSRSRICWCIFPFTNRQTIQPQRQNSSHIRHARDRSHHAGDHR